MPSAKLPHCSFLHFAKTGGWAVCRAICEAGIPIEVCDVNDGRGGHVTLPGPAFAFVRNPYTWYPSLYGYLSCRNWTDPWPKSNSLDEFVEVSDMSKWFFDFITPQTIICKYENLHADLTRVLRYYGEEFTELTLHRENVTPHKEVLSNFAKAKIAKEPILEMFY
jgi:hypothetical protein